MTEPGGAKPKIPAPPSLSQTLVKRILGFGVWIAVGLAPFLGAYRIPLFSALLELYPASLRPVLLPLSGFLMGVIALKVETAGAGRLTRKSLDRWLRRAEITLAASFLLLVVLYQFMVARVQYQRLPPPAPAETQAFVTGALTVPAHPSDSKCQCPQGQSAEDCIEDIAAKDNHVRTCFGPGRVKLASLALTILYLTLTGSFAAAVGVFVLRQKMEKDRRRTR
ncbi:MAG TPA: hypothetical protein VH394_02855 [Thermoanaerobaculia bacterium]|jgi:hypothetical protein|nr:hypothetical protein [Thermoanaerobaculia bacterium]